MLTSSGAGPALPIARSKITYLNNIERDNHAPAVQSGNYDSISLSSAGSHSRFHNELVGRLSQEVRTATTTGDIRMLREEVSSGSYTPDPVAIASEIMLFREDA